MSRRRTLIFALGLAGVAVVLAATAFVAFEANRVRQIFAANAALKEEGYYLSPFEFELLSVSYYLDHGQYLKGISRLNQIHEQMTTREGLVRIPEFSDAQEELAFFKGLQNPDTGAFYPNDDDPVVTNIGVTANMINLIEALSVKAGEPFALDYPLSFLNRIDTSEELTAMLDDASQVGWIGTMIKPAFVSAVELQELIEQDERLGIYGFPEDWKQSYYRWFYDEQNPETGLWGPRDRRTGEMLEGGDIGDSGKIIKMFVDSDGDNLRPGMPLRYADRIFASVIAGLSRPMPEAPDRLHRWIIDQDRGFRFLTKYVWKNATPAEREAVQDLLERFITTRFALFYLPDEGAFSLYPDAAHADLDGTSEAAGMLDYAGELSATRQALLWGSPAETIRPLGNLAAERLDEHAMSKLSNADDLVSVRFYAEAPTDDFTATPLAIYYPRAPVVRDTVDLLVRLRLWLDTTTQTMGNWGRRDAIMERISATPVSPDAAVLEGQDTAFLDALLQEHGKLVAIGFDTLQVPRYRIDFEAP
ncbi:hypothetical protein FF124_15385 [Martelella lutilitoris]|uniref:Uncharacterized protein n=1 Tax=Martelella lutilitoris TaxID=2583532 RepID=A0A5C4JNQ9_9HYPH|nr:hypothetical protein [Martelella lutilitoris]TNB46930.1 hypothetical protein FF124_15385 [Martelella lutilitoris]